MHRLVAPLIGSATLMAAYLIMRHYGDTTSEPALIATAIADWRWVAAHLCGLLALALFAWMTQRLVDASRDAGGRGGTQRRSPGSLAPPA